MFLLENLGKCPVCSSPTNNNSRRDDAFENLGGREYLKPLAESEGVSLDELLAEMQSYQCSNCHAYYLEPWLSSYARSRVFVTGHPIHNVGWRNLQQWSERSLIPEIPGGIDSLYNKIRCRVGIFKTYIEFGCPFQGLILGLAPPEDTKVLLRTSSAQFTMPTRHAQRRLLPPLYWYLRLSNHIFRFSQFLTLIRRTRDKIRGRHRKSASKFRVPDHSLFVPLSSSRFWGANCSMYGGSCSALISQFSNVVVSSRPEVMKTEVHHYDVSGLFNVLDHQDDPLTLLREVLRVSKLVVCMSHNVPFSRQHHFGLGESFFHNLPRLIRGCEVEQVSDLGEANCAFFVSMPRQAAMTL